MFLLLSNFLKPHSKKILNKLNIFGSNDRIKYQGMIFFRIYKTSFYSKFLDNYVCFLKLTNKAMSEYTGLKIKD